MGLAIGIKQLAGTLFWRRRSKTGALFGIFLAAVLSTVAAPVLLLAYDTMEDWHMWLCWPPEWMGRGFLFLCAAGLYALALQLLFFRDLLRRTFHWSQTRAGLLSLSGLLIPFAGVLVPCALRTRNRNRKAAILASAGLFFLLPCGAIAFTGLDLTLLFAFAAFACCLACVLAIRAMPVPCEPVAPWYVLPPAVVFLTLLLPGLAQPWLDRAMEQNAGHLRLRTGLDITIADIEYQYTNGIPRTTPSYGFFFNNTAGLYHADPSLPPGRNTRAGITNWMVRNTGMIVQLDARIDEGFQHAAYRIPDPTDPRTITPGTRLLALAKGLNNRLLPFRPNTMPANPHNSSAAFLPSAVSWKPTPLSTVGPASTPNATACSPLATFFPTFPRTHLPCSTPTSKPLPNFPGSLKPPCSLTPSSNNASSSVSASAMPVPTTPSTTPAAI